MTITRRHVLAGAIAAPAIIGSSAPRFGCGPYRQDFPSVPRRYGRRRAISATACAASSPPNSRSARTASIVAQIYPNSSLMKTVAQFSAVRKGVLDISLYPISYAGGEFAELNIGLMPGLVSSYKQGAAWKKAPVGQKFSAVPRREGRHHGVLDLAGRRLREPRQVDRQSEDAKGMKIRGGSREIDMLLQAAGATTLSTPSNELYAAMQTGACDATYTSSTSLISFRLEEVAKSLTTGRGKSYWFMLEPLIMSKQVFDALSKEAAGRHHGARPGDGGVWHQGSHGRRPEGIRSLRQEGRAGSRSRRCDRREVAGHCARYRVEGLRRQDRRCRRNCSSSPKASRSPDRRRNL